MNFQKHAIILAVVEALKEQGSWTGKTHVQKSLFLAQAAHAYEVPFTFVLYKHGPYSFELEHEMEEMKSYGAMEAEAVLGQGVILSPGPTASLVEAAAPVDSKVSCSIVRISKFVGAKNVIELERLATAAWIRTREGVKQLDQVATRLHELKPHIPIAEAAKAGEELNTLLAG